MKLREQSQLPALPPTAGIRIFCSEQRSQGRNRERALALLRARLLDAQREKQRSETQAARKSQVREWGRLVLPCFEPSCMYEQSLFTPQ